MKFVIRAKNMSSSAQKRGESNGRTGQLQNHLRNLLSSKHNKKVAFSFRRSLRTNRLLCLVSVRKERDLLFRGKLSHLPRQQLLRPGSLQGRNGREMEKWPERDETSESLFTGDWAVAWERAEMCAARAECQSAR